jgi:hypothetical protein
LKYSFFGCPRCLAELSTSPPTHDSILTSMPTVLPALRACAPDLVCAEAGLLLLTRLSTGSDPSAFTALAASLGPAVHGCLAGHPGPERVVEPALRLLRLLSAGTGVVLGTYSLCVYVCV